MSCTLVYVLLILLLNMPGCMVAWLDYSGVIHLGCTPDQKEQKK